MEIKDRFGMRGDVLTYLQFNGKSTASDISKAIELPVKKVLHTIYNARSDLGCVEIEKINGGEDLFYLCDNPAPYQKFYVELYEKMATDNPRELWSFIELTNIYDKSYDCIKAAMTRIRKNICGVECIRIRDESGRLISHYRLLDGD